MSNLGFVISSVPLLQVREHNPSSSLLHLAHLSLGERGTGNAIIQGENSGVLHDLSAMYADRVRCVYIDPPYNNQERYTHYDDNLNHAAWLDNMVVRLECIKKLLKPDGSLWISIDDREVHYLKVAADAVFGRKNFITTIIWQQRTTRENRKVFSNNHEYILVYAKDAASFKSARNLLPLTEEVEKRYKNPDNDPRGPWQSVSANVQDGHATKSQFYDVKAPNGTCHAPPKGRCWVYTKERMQEEISKNNVWFGKEGNGVPRLKRFMSHSRQGVTPETLWTASEVGTNKSAKTHLAKLFLDQPVFDTPKPEQLIYRIFQIATAPNDLVLDAYLGSGTTTAVAHKMGRQYIGIEFGPHAVNLCVERMRQVIEGEKGGISVTAGWTGGGGFDFYKAC